MQQTYKTVRPFKWMIPALVTVTLFTACNSGPSKADSPITDSSSKMDSGSSKMAKVADTLKPVKDTLPPIDTTVKHRPEDRVIKKPS